MRTLVFVGNKRENETLEEGQENRRKTLREMRERE